MSYEWLKRVSQGLHERFGVRGEDRMLDVHQAVLFLIQKLYIRD